MKSKLFWTGVVLSAAYIGIMLWFFGARFADLQGQALNEVGDFLAGAFSPLAFLWLVLGFLQQGQELRQGTEALQLQADELKRSVEQQTIMADAATRQIQAQIASLELEQAEHKRRFAPVLRFSTQTGSSGATRAKSQIRITNLGAAAEGIEVRFDPPIAVNEPYTIGAIGRDLDRPAVFEYDRPDTDVSGRCEITYFGLDEDRRTIVMSYSISSRDWWLRITPSAMATT